MEPLGGSLGHELSHRDRRVSARFYRQDLELVLAGWFEKLGENRKVGHRSGKIDQGPPCAPIDPGFR